MNSQSFAQFRSAVESAFGQYLSTHAFVEVSSGAAARLRTLAYQSSDFSLSFFLEGLDDLYAKVSPPGEPEHGFYLGATLAFITGMSEPYLDKEALSRLLPEKHDELALLFAKDAVQEREKLQAWARAYAQRSAAALQEHALERQTKRKWWRFGA